MKIKKAEKQTRKRCIYCSAMKYIKFMREIDMQEKIRNNKWCCLNEDKCVHRSANYKK